MITRLLTLWHHVNLCRSHLGNDPEKPRCELPSGHVGTHRHYGFGWGLNDNGRPAASRSTT